MDIDIVNIKNTDLIMKLRRNTKPSRVKNRKKKLCTIIFECPVEIDNRMKFGHWDIDTIVG